MRTKIGYCPWQEKNQNTTNTALNYFGWFDLAHFELERLDTWDNSSSRYHKCPAFTQYVKEIYVIRNSIDIELTWDKANKVLSSNLPFESSESFIRVHWQDFDPEQARPIVALSNSFVFTSDKPVFLELIPPFNDIDNSWRLVPGSFNIYSWQRPIVTTFEMLEDKVKIKRGRPIAYVKFRSENLNDKFLLKKIERTNELEHAVNSCLTLKHYMPRLSWKIHNTFNKLRPKKWMK